MLRRAPTSISLSNRDVAEHLEHIEQQKLRDRENAQRRQLGRISCSKTSGFRPAASGNCREENWKRQATFPQSEQAVQHEPYGGDTRISFYAVDSLNEQFQDEMMHQNAQTNQELPGQWSNQVETTEPVLDPCTGSEDEEGFIPINLLASTESYEEGTVLLQQEYHHQSRRTSQPRFSHGFAETTSEGSSSIGKRLPQRVSSQCAP
jgi:Anaphase-promoting complex APC subunit CDC26